MLELLMDCAERAADLRRALLDAAGNLRLDYRLDVDVRFDTNVQLDWLQKPVASVVEFLAELVRTAFRGVSGLLSVHSMAGGERRYTDNWLSQLLWLADNPGEVSHALLAEFLTWTGAAKEV